MKKPSVQMAFFVYKKPSKSEGYIVEKIGFPLHFRNTPLGKYSKKCF